MSIEDFSNRLDIFKKSFEAITSNLEVQLKKVEAEVDKLVANTEIIPKIKDSNKEMFKKLQSVSGTVGELIYRLDLIESKNL